MLPYRSNRDALAPPKRETVDPSTLATPILSPDNSTEPSPAFSTILQSPDVSDDEDDFSIGAAATHDGDDEATSTKPKQRTEETEKDLPECWGHRGASAAYPENTRASFIEACKAGADGIETDIHITSDNRLVMFHDPELHRTTNGTGRIDDQPWTGVLEHVRTLKEPHQPIPLFTEVLEILMSPEYQHVKLNIDCKVESEPVKLFTMIRAEIEKYANWQTVLAPRLILGIWHPKFLQPALEILPYLPRFAISMSIPQVRQYFFNNCHGFSLMYEVLASKKGEEFRKECKKLNKEICAWTVNGKEEMRECVRWGVKSIISDKPDQWRAIKKDILANRKAALKPTLTTYVLPYLQKKNYWFEYQRLANEETEYLEREAGKFDKYAAQAMPIRIARPGDALV